MSTPDFGRPTLRALLDRGCDVVGLICQPDKPAGRGRRLTPPPMKQVALAWDIPVLQPASLSTAEARQQVSALRPDLILVAAYGKFIPDTILELAPIGALNLHPSLLPRWRGACPVPAAILAGDRETGVTIHFVVNEMDAGDILGQAIILITERDRAGELMARLAVLGAELYATTIEGRLAGRITPHTQDHAQAVWHDRLRKAQGRLDWTRPADALARQVRAFDPWPGTFTPWGDTSLRILDTEPWRDWRGDLAPGEVFGTPERIAVATGQGALILRTVQAEGKRRLPVEQFWLGSPGFVGATLG